MLHELFITHCTNGTLIMNPFTRMCYMVMKTRRPGKEMADVGNHKKFTLRYLRVGITPASNILSIRIAISYDIIRKSENTINQLKDLMYHQNPYICGIKKDANISKHVCVCIGRDTLQECQAFMNRVREIRHLKVIKRQKSKYFGSKWSGGHSNICSSQDQNSSFGW